MHFDFRSTHPVTPSALFYALLLLLQEISSSLNPAHLIPGGQQSVPVEQPKKQCVIRLPSILFVLSNDVVSCVAALSVQVTCHLGRRFVQMTDLIKDTAAEQSGEYCCCRLLLPLEHNNPNQLHRRHPTPLQSSSRAVSCCCHQRSVPCPRTSPSSLCARSSVRSALL